MDKIFDFIEKRKKTFIAMAAFVMIASLSIFGFQKYRESQITELSYMDFIKLVENDKVDEIRCISNKDVMTFTLINGSEYKTSYPDYEDFKKDMLLSGVKVTKTWGFSEEGFMVVIDIIVIAVYVSVMLVFTKGIGNIKAKDILQKSDVKFNQIIGLDEIMNDISLYVSMIKNPHIGDEIGAKLPKGVLLTGDPGTGKTLIAKAIAGEADVPFISVSGSEFAELYKGVGAKRVRKVFKIARKNAPCVVFIDEIDAIGGKRTGHKTDSEDTQIINQLLKEMDGFKTLEGVFVLAATNCPDNLDDALKRSGRFDRQVNIMPPRDWKVRKQLLEFYLKNYKIAEDVNIESLAKSIAGFTGADIATICNEASLVAIVKGYSAINIECINEAIDKKIFSGNKDKSEQYAKDRLIVAYHEAGHAVMKHLVHQPIARASIVGTTSGVGGAVFGEDKEGFLQSKNDIRGDIAVCYAGRAAELAKFGEVSTGAVNDITKATEYIMAYVEKYGFDEETGAIDMRALRSKNVIDAKDISGRIKAISKELEEFATESLKNHFDMVDRLAKELLDKETLDGKAIEDILRVS